MPQPEPPPKPEVPIREASDKIGNVDLLKANPAADPERDEKMPAGLSDCLHSEGDVE